MVLCFAKYFTSDAMKYLNRIGLSIAACCITTWLISCAADPVATNTVPTNHTLHSGDAFIYHRSQTDQTGAAVAGGDTTFTASVFSADQPFAGKNAVSAISGDQDTLYFSMNSDSAFYIWQAPIGITSGASIPGVWVPFPMQAGAVSVLDSTQPVVIANMPATVRSTIGAAFVRRGTVTISGTTYDVIYSQKTVDVTVAIAGSGQDYTTHVVVTYAFVPKIGYFASKVVTTNSNSSYSPIPNGTVTDSLVSFSLP
jgi:hypothetical protein